MTLMGPTPFEDMIFYLWTDSKRNLHSICKIENKSHFIRENFLIFDLVFEKITIFLFFEGYFLGNFQKNRSQKPSMLEENKDSFGICIEFLTKL